MGKLALEFFAFTNLNKFGGVGMGVPPRYGYKACVTIIPFLLTREILLHVTYLHQPPLLDLVTVKYILLGAANDVSIK